MINREDPDIIKADFFSMAATLVLMVLLIILTYSFTAHFTRTTPAPITILCPCAPLPSPMRSDPQESHVPQKP